MGRPVSAGASDGYHSGCLVCGACCQCRPSSVPGLICPGRHPRRLTIAMSTAVGFGLGDSVPCSTLLPRCLPTPDNTGCCLRPTRPSCSPFSSPVPSHTPTTAADSSHNRHSAPHDTGGASTGGLGGARYPGAVPVAPIESHKIPDPRARPPRLTRPASAAGTGRGG